MLPSLCTTGIIGMGYRYHKREMPVTCRTIYERLCTYLFGSVLLSVFEGRSFLRRYKFLKWAEMSVAKITSIISYFIFEGFELLLKISKFFSLINAKNY